MFARIGLCSLGMVSIACALGEDRVAVARFEKLAGLKRQFKTKGLSYPAQAVYYRVIKDERIIEAWASDDGRRFRLFKSYRIAAMSGELGPKLRQGDLQVPEGFYVVDRYNDRSRFYLSLGINYPNARDRALGESKPGGDIFIHGSRVSIGCLAMTNEVIKEIYLLALDSRARPIQVHIFPMRMEGPLYGVRLMRATPDVRELWESMRPAWLAFEKTRRLPGVSVQGRSYKVRM